MHWAFGNITESYAVDVSQLQKEFDGMKKLKGIKKIISFGGWSFSTDHDTFPIFREGTTATNRATFAKNVVKFVNDNNLDGVDFDWVSTPSKLPILHEMLTSHHRNTPG